MVVVKRSSKELDINIRHSASLTGNDRQRMSVLREILHQLHILWCWSRWRLGRRTEDGGRKGKAGRRGLQGLQLLSDDYTIVYEDTKLM